MATNIQMQSLALIYQENSEADPFSSALVPLENAIQGCNLAGTNLHGTAPGN